MLFRSIKQFDYVTKLASDYSQGYAFRAESYIGKEKWAEATDDIVKALSLDWDRKAHYLAGTLKEPAFTMLVSKIKVQSAKSPNEATWPYILDTDSLIFRDLKRPQEPMNIWKRIIHDDIFKWEFKGDEPITIAVNPYFNFELGKEQEEGKNIWVNTRGLTLEGKLGKKLAFYSAIYENQAVFPQYIDEFIDTRGVVPGQGRAKTFGDNGWDYSQSSGYLSYNAGKWVNMTLGYGKNFIGDGYRSLLLSDNSYS